MATEHKDVDGKYWAANTRLILGLLAVWAGASYGCSILFVEALNKIQFFGLPFGFWMAQQGTIYIFIALIYYYARRMDHLDRQFHKDQD